MLSQAPRQSDIRNFLVVLFSGVMVACGIVGLMVYLYSPTGRYWSHHALLSPEILSGMAYSDFDPATGQTKRYLFERVEFSYYDKAKSKWISVPVDDETYQRFWKAVEGDWSMLNPPENMLSRFSQSQPSRLAVWARPDPAVAPVKVFQEIDFSATTGMYRVELHGEEDITGQWAYFEHPNIYQKVIDLFVSHQ